MLTTRRRALVTRGLWAGAGVAVGGAVGLLIGLHLSGSLSAIWVAAVGLLLTFAGFVVDIQRRQQDVAYRIEKDQRDEQVRVEARAAEAEADRRRIVDEAAAVMLRAFGGGGFGGNPSPIQCTGVQFEVINGSERPLTLESVNVEPAVVPTHRWELPRSLAAGETLRWMQAVENFELPLEEASGQPITSRPTIMRYKVGGRVWERLGDGEPTLIKGDL